MKIDTDITPMTGEQIDEALGDAAPADIGHNSGDAFTSDEAQEFAKGMEEALGIRASSIEDLERHRDTFLDRLKTNKKMANAVFKRRGDVERCETTAWFSDCLEGQMTADEAMKLEPHRRVAILRGMAFLVAFKMIRDGCTSPIDIALVQWILLSCDNDTLTCDLGMRATAKRLGKARSTVMEAIERVRQLDYFDFEDHTRAPSWIRPRYLFASAASVSGTNLVDVFDYILKANDAGIDVEEALSAEPRLLSEDELNLPDDELMRLINGGGPVDRTRPLNDEQEGQAGPVDRTRVDRPAGPGWTGSPDTTVPSVSTVPIERMNEGGEAYTSFKMEQGSSAGEALPVGEDNDAANSVPATALGPSAIETLQASAKAAAGGEVDVPLDDAAFPGGEALVQEYCRLTRNAAEAFTIGNLRAAVMSIRYAEGADAALDFLRGAITHAEANNADEALAPRRAVREPRQPFHIELDEMPNVVPFPSRRRATQVPPPLDAGDAVPLRRGRISQPAPSAPASAADTPPADRRQLETQRNAAPPLRPNEAGVNMVRKSKPNAALVKLLKGVCAAQVGTAEIRQAALRLDEKYDLDDTKAALAAIKQDVQSSKVAPLTSPLKYVAARIEMMLAGLAEAPDKAKVEMERQAKKPAKSSKPSKGKADPNQYRLDALLNQSTWNFCDTEVKRGDFKKTYRSKLLKGEVLAIITSPEFEGLDIGEAMDAVEAATSSIAQAETSADGRTIVRGALTRLRHGEPEDHIEGAALHDWGDASLGHKSGRKFLNEIEEPDKRRAISCYAAIGQRWLDVEIAKHEALADATKDDREKLLRDIDGVVHLRVPTGLSLPKDITDNLREDRYGPELWQTVEDAARHMISDLAKKVAGGPDEPAVVDYNFDDERWCRR